MIVIDYNGTGIWSAEQILNRYANYVKKYQIDAPRDLTPLVSDEGEKRWIYPVMDHVIEGIEAGDLACAEIGIEFIEEDQSFTFGQILKSNTARALRRISLTEEQKERIRKRVVAMLLAGYLPREYRQYAKLARKIGLGQWFHEIKKQMPAENPWVNRYYRYFEEHANH
ncbi:MAG TPA: hypothetical protein VFS90_04920 [Pyrinomonadaceae bacterium]|nr:hypothetical protein [Pyrinomonadaceae bacterium]